MNSREITVYVKKYRLAPLGYSSNRTLIDKRGIDICSKKKEKKEQI